MERCLPSNILTSSMILQQCLQSVSQLVEDESFELSRLTFPLENSANTNKSLINFVKGELILRKCLELEWF